MKRTILLSLLGVAGALIANSLSYAQAEHAAAPPMVTRIYRVSDLVVPTPDYTFRGIQLPGLGTTSAGGSTFGGGAMGGGGGGYGEGMMGGGMFAVPSDSSKRGSAGGMAGGGGGSGMGGMSGMGGGGMGGMGSMGGIGMGGGGFGAVAPRRQTAGALRFTMDDLMTAILRMVDPESWEDVGGRGTITPLGGMLLIANTQTVHEQVAELLDAIRQEGAAVRSVTIQAYWLLLTPEQLQQLAAPGGTTHEITAATLNSLAEAIVARGQVTCFDGQTVHIASGRIRTSVTSLIPVVGQIDSHERYQDLARKGSQEKRRRAGEVNAEPAIAALPDHVLGQLGNQLGGGQPSVSSVPWSEPNRNVGYQPVVTAVNFGTVLQVTPMLIPDTHFIVLDLQSVVTRTSADPAAAAPSQPLGLDRVDLVVQQFRTTLRLPLGKPALVAGSTLEPSMTSNASDGQLYLVVQAALANEQAKPAAGESTSGPKSSTAR